MISLNINFPAKFLQMLIEMESEFEASFLIKLGVRVRSLSNERPSEMTHEK